MRRRPRPHRRRALQAVHELARQRGERARLGRPRFLGRGLHRGAWCIPVDLEARDDWQEWVAQVPEHGGGADDRRFRKELALLRGLDQRERPFGIPSPVGRVQVDHVTVTITHFCPGAPVDAGHLEPRHAAAILGTVAAQVHQLPWEGLVFPNTSHATARADASQGLAELLEVRDADPPLLDDVLAWCQAHLPPADAPAVLTHGDLLGQNVLHRHDGPPAVVDWELAGTGDPAADLAIITRGKRRPLGGRGTRQLLLDTYNELAPYPVTAERVYLHELCMVADEVAWAREAGHTEQERQFLDQLTRLWNKGRRRTPSPAPRRSAPDGGPPPDIRQPTVPPTE